jgi:hypothetical protein
MVGSRKKPVPQQPLWRWQHVIALIACLAAITSATLVLRNKSASQPSAQIGDSNCGSTANAGNQNTTTVSGTITCK